METTMSTPSDSVTAGSHEAPRIAINMDGHREAAPRNVAKARAEALSFHYGAHRALKDINLEIPERMVTALIGPSGCG